MCWQVSVGQLMVINDIINATLVAGDTMEWVYVEL
jgi:hypothetical protein